jgi:ATP-dependent exoDNAse (exonuclease V) beta subunit
MSISNDVLAGLTRAQATAAALSGPVLVLAGAGTGKTKTLIAGIAHRIARRGIPPARILAVTFTNKAAAEMTGRIRATWARQRPRTGSEPSTGSGRASCAASRRSPDCAPASTLWMPTTAAASSSASCRR